MIISLLLLLFCKVSSIGLVTGGIYDQGHQSFKTNLAQIFCEFRQLGLKWIRIESDWPGTTPQTYQLVFPPQKLVHNVRAIVRAAHSHGISVNLIVPARFCGDDNQPPQVDTFISAYLAHLDELVSTVFVGTATVDAFEIGNELNIFEKGMLPPDLTLLIPPGCSDNIGRFRVGPNAFAWLVRRAYEWKINKGRWEKIISGGLLNTYMTEGFWPAMFSSGAWQGQTFIDYFGVHPYDPYTINNDCINAGRTDCFGEWQSQIQANLVSIQQMIQSKTNNPSLKLFVTEFGLQVSPNGRCNPNQNCVINSAQQAAGMKVAVQAIFGSQVVYEALWYDYRSDDGEKFGIRGVWNGSAFPPVQPTWQMFKTLAGGSGPSDPNTCW